ncbi:MAG TPA: tRNA (N(6)-L-threonylcarbamoyladenosine(37)-C(2))-methylthiotransferase MtaB [Bacteroidia bacterium]|nr:tRNA (N(6)-L-threonylcarbamoyladenosine(37)-C(2))-methylthiotransferase MtaB [Bacteroidia bacterium]
MISKSTVAFHTLGCKLNFSETSTIARKFEEAGFQKTDFNNGADIYVINTCSVTENADKECKTIVHRALNQNPDAFIAIIGCYAQLKPHEISSIEGVDLILGATEKFNIVNHIGEAVKKQKAEIFACEIAGAKEFVSSFSTTERTRAFLKVQDGCDYNCSFCTIPLARGKSRSNRIENVLNNVKKIASCGVKEIVLTGVNLGDFGYESGVRGQLAAGSQKKIIFLDLIKELDKVEGIERFRISSIEPNLLADEIIEFVSSSKKFVPHFHIPLQSGSDKILGLMRRRYLSGLYAQRINKIRSWMPHCCVGVDVIVGFPGETSDDFLETYNFLNGLDISYLHVFTYSERENTHAVQLPGRVPVHERKKRNQMLRILSEKKSKHFYEQQIGKELNVLFESESNSDSPGGMMHGFTENYIKVKTPFDALLINQIIPVKISEVDHDGVAIIEDINEMFQV